MRVVRIIWKQFIIVRSYEMKFTTNNIIFLHTQCPAASQRDNFYFCILENWLLYGLSLVSSDSKLI